MDFKRVQISPMQSPTNRSNPLIQPLINISKASTPIRMRVVNNAGPMNSTPVNINKIPQKIQITSNNSNLDSKGDLHDNRDNKQNSPHNMRYATSQQSSINLLNIRRNAMGKDISQDIKQPSKIYHFNNNQQAKFNLSPVMALNRKIKEGPSRSANKNSKDFDSSPGKISVKSYSKTSLFVEESNDNSTSILQNISNVSVNQNQDYYQFDQPSKSPQKMLGSKQYFSNTNNNNLKSSNCFKSMLQSKNKTPPRLGSMAFASLSKKQSSNSSNNSLRNSLSTNNMIGGLMSQKGSQKKLIQSRSHQRINLIRSPQKSQFPLCKNQDGNKAKYKVVGVDGDYQDDEQILAYCHECSKAVIHNGFNVTQINQRDIAILNNQQNSQFGQNRSPNHRPVSPIHVTIDQAHRLKHSLLSKIGEINQQRKIYIDHYNNQLDKVDSFYNSVIQLIQEQRVADRQAIISIRDKNKLGAKRYQTQVQQTLCRVEQLLQTLQGNQNSKQFRNTIAIKSQLNEYQNVLCKNGAFPQLKEVVGDIQAQYDHFAQIFYSQMKLILNMGNSLKARKSILNSNKNQNNISTRFNNNQQAYQYGLVRQDHNNHQNHSLHNKSNPLRFSFQKMANKNKLFLNPNMNTLTQQNEQSLEDQDSFQKNNQYNEANYTYQNQYGETENAMKRPFRDLFFDQQSQSQEIKAKKPIVSPTFKNI